MIYTASTAKVVALFPADMKMETGISRICCLSSTLRAEMTCRRTIE